MKYESIYLEMLLSIEDSNKNKAYKISDIYYFKSLPNDFPIQIYTSFIYKNLFHKDDRFNIEKENFELFLLKNKITNAFAYTKGKHNIIGIHLELLDKLEIGIKEACQNLDQKISAFFIKEDKLPNIESLIFRFITLFIFFHELAHLIQNKNYYKYSGLRYERYNLQNIAEYSEECHLAEIDADLFASQYLTNFIHQSWAQFSDDLKSILNIEMLIALGTSSIFLLFYELSDKRWSPIYYYSKSHPHPFIRISYIVDLMNKHIIETLQLDVKQYEFQLFNTFQVASTLLNTENRKVFKGFQSQYIYELPKINAYLNALSKKSSTLPYLIQNLKSFEYDKAK